MSDLYQETLRRYQEALQEVKQQKPPALNIFADMCITLLRLTDDELAHVMHATLEYFTAGVMPENLSRAEFLTFETVKNGIDRSTETYQKQQEQRTLAGYKKFAKEHGFTFP